MTVFPGYFTWGKATKRMSNNLADTVVNRYLLPAVVQILTSDFIRSGKTGNNNE